MAHKNDRLEFMKKLTETQKNIVKWICVGIILALIVYVFRDSAGPIFHQLKKTSLTVVLLIVAATLLYSIFESVITWLLARQYNPNFRFRQAFGMTYFCAFYRTITMGSGAGVAAIVYMSGNGVQASEACGMYTIEYAIHKLSIAILSAILFFMNYDYMQNRFKDYRWYLLAGFGLTIIITACLMLFACAAWFHRILYALMELFNFKGKFTEFFQKVRNQCMIMETASKKLLKKKGMLAGLILINFVKLACWFMIPYIVLYHRQVLTPMHALAMTAVCVMLAAVIPVPAGIGSSEFVLIGLFSGFVGTSAAGAMALLYRFATFLFPCAVGAVVAAFFGRIKKAENARLEHLQDQT